MDGQRGVGGTGGVDELLIVPFGDSVVACGAERGAVAAFAIREEGDLADPEGGGLSLECRKVHLAFGIRKDSQVCDLVYHFGEDPIVVRLLNPYQDEKAGPD